jgi:succinoglycan biosynthesis transport protein ExoP
MSDSEPFREGQSAHPDRSAVPVPQTPGKVTWRGAPDAVAFREFFVVLRRHIWLILIVTASTMGAAAFLALRDPSVYRATATVRLSEGLRALTADIDGTEAPPAPQRTIDPVLSLSEHLRSRQVVGSVVDSLGTRLSSLSPDFPVSSLGKIRVDPAAPADTIMVHFADQEVVGHAGSVEVHAPYGGIVRIRGVEFAVTSRPNAGTQDALLSVSAREAEIDRVLASVELVERQSTDVVDVSYTAPDPKTAQQVANAIVQTFQAVNIRAAQEQSRLRRVFLSEQLRQTDSLLAKAQGSLATFRSRQQLANSSDRLAAVQAAMLALDSQREQLQADRRTYGELPDLLGSPNDSVSGRALRNLAFSPGMASNPAIAKLSQQLVEYQIRLDSLTTGNWRIATTNPDLEQLTGAMASTKQELFGAVASQVTALDARIDALAALRRQSATSMQVLPALEAEEMRLEARVEALRTVGDHLRQESQKARLAEAAEVGDMQIMDLAGLPYLSTWPMGWLKLALGLLAGLFLGAGGAYLMEANNTSVRRFEDLEEELQIAGMAVIPRLPGANKAGRRPLPRFFKSNKDHHGGKVTAMPQGLVTLTDPRSIGTEAFRMLRTSLIWSEWGKRLKSIVVTSVAPGEGKTLTAANLGVIFARGGMRVLLVDGDLRRARLHKIFLLPRGPGLTELIRANGGNGGAIPVGDGGTPLMNRNDMLSIVRYTSVEGLFLLPAGGRSHSPDAFRETQVRHFLRELSDVFDLVIVDASPVLASADAAILASMADGVLLVVSAGRTDRGAIHHAHQQLVKVGARVVGTVLNDPQGKLKQTEEYYYPYEYPEVKD